MHIERNDLRIVLFEHPDEFLAFGEQRDDSSTNFGVGALLECRVWEDGQWKWDSREKVLIGVFKGTELL